MAKSKTRAVYDDRSISALKGADRVRKRPAVIFGSDGLDGCIHSAFEILSNAVDEAREGYGRRIVLTAFRDHSLEVEDDGRGVPLGYNEREGRYNWDLIFCELYAGGKYDNNSGEGAYEYALGLNGLGACATQYSSEYMTVRSYNGQALSEISFRRGEVDGELAVRPLAPREKKHGTIIRWKPDLAVFTDIAIPREVLVDMCKRQAVVNAGVKFLLRWEEEDGSFTEEEFSYERGILDRVRELAGEECLTEPILWKSETSGRDREDKPEYKLKMEACFCCSAKVNAIEYYHNSSYLEHGGSPDKAVKSAFVSAIDKYLRANGKYRKNEAKITFSDVEDCLVLVTSCFSTLVSYENQTKKAITNRFVAEAMTDWLKKSLEIFFLENPADGEKLAERVLINRRSRESAENTRLDVRKKLAAAGGDLASRVEKFTGCRSRDPERRELYIVEGDSAKSSCLLSRNAEFQAVMPVRGKTLNCLKASYDRIFASEVIVNLLKVIGCGAEISSRKTKGEVAPFRYEDLRWNKIILCTDADEDGFQIRTLLLTLFYRLLPTLIEKGKIYIAETPLFEIICGGESYFAYDEPEKEAILRQLDGKKVSIQRSKGLGENEPEMMARTTMNPATRRLIRVTPTDAGQTSRLFDTLLGDNLPARKEFIFREGGRYFSEADI